MIEINEVPVVPWVIVIRTVMNGYVVEIGCKEFVIADPGELTRTLYDLFTNPQPYIDKYDTQPEPQRVGQAFRRFGRGRSGQIGVPPPPNPAPEEAPPEAPQEERP